MAFHYQFFLIQGLQAILVNEEFEHIILSARITALNHLNYKSLAHLITGVLCLAKLNAYMAYSYSSFDIFDALKMMFSFSPLSPAH